MASGPGAEERARMSKGTGGRARKEEDETMAATVNLAGRTCNSIFPRLPQLRKRVSRESLQHNERAAAEGHGPSASDGPQLVVATISFASEANRRGQLSERLCRKQRNKTAAKETITSRSNPTRAPPTSGGGLAMFPFGSFD